LIKTAIDNNYDLKIVSAVEKANEYQKNVIPEKITKYFGNDLQDLSFGIWGLSFKPNTDDVRESSSIYLINKLLEKKAKIKVYDPAAMNECKKVFGDKIEYCKDQYHAIENVDAMVLMTEWSDFRLPNFGKMSKIMKGKVIFDGRNIYDPEEIRKNNFIYFGIGRQ
ncbi:MAG: UDP-glucose/GDP-mannose dehydrogenase family protein, partial [Bacteroidales bacterium]|nr:UDP-glucose/GDP-mannose dehydrogenase family protein [Bacteroidales bacterium]